MSGRLYINGKLMDMGATRDIPITKQVNTIGNLSNRQVDFSRTITLPFTPDNRKNLQFLGIPGSRGRFPYQVNTARYEQNGVTLVKEGVAVLKETSVGYRMHIYEGLVSFYKAIENRNLSDIGLEALNHVKNLDAVVDTWNDRDKPYLYIVADYNGKARYQSEGTDVLNVDYLVPSANLKWLWDKVFDYAGFTYEGSTFSGQEFMDHYLSYPKATGSSDPQLTFIHEWHYTIPYVELVEIIGGVKQLYHRELIFDNPLLDSALASMVSLHLVQVSAPGLYRIELDGFLTQNEPVTSPLNVQVERFVPGSGPGQVETLTIVEDIDVTKRMEASLNFVLSEDEVFTVTRNGTGLTVYGTGDLKVRFYKVEGDEVDFGDAFIDFGIKQFINEVMWRFALVPFPDGNHVTFLTYDEWLGGDDPIDWSGKFVDSLGEQYIIGDYAQRNWLRYSYNDDNDTHHDGFFTIPNENLNDSVDMVVSSFFAPISAKSNNALVNSNVYPFWSKDNKDDGSVEYKSLDNRYYLIRSVDQSVTLTVGSESFGQTTSVSSIPRESFEGLDFTTIVRERYRSLSNVLVDSKLLTVNLRLNNLDMAGLDLKRSYHFEQLGGNFIINRVKDYIDRRLTKCELYQVSPRSNSGIVPDPLVTISSQAVPPVAGVTFNWVIATNYTFTNFLPTNATITHEQYDQIDGTPTGLEYSSQVNVSQNTFNQTVELGVSGWFRVQVQAEGALSNVEWVEVAPDTEPPREIARLRAAEFDVPDTLPLKERILAVLNFTPAGGTGNLTAREYEFTGDSLDPTGQEFIVVIDGLTDGSNIWTQTFPNQGYWLCILEADGVKSREDSEPVFLSDLDLINVI